ncbi:MAG TPA: copper chaperone PCu(A)C, partial [Gallionellaceae bacterium]|nr:copper chaperone PCu(A)C [Gallionellaceae bacterium]
GKMIKPGWLGLGALLLAAQCMAGELTVSDVWSRATAPGQEATVVGLRITSQKDARMVAVSSPVAEAQMHSMIMDNGMMKMRKQESLALPAKQEVLLGAGGDHLMLVGLKKPLRAGEVVPLTLTVEFADKHTEKVEIKAEVKPLTHTHEMQMQEHH